MLELLQLDELGNLFFYSLLRYKIFCKLFKSYVRHRTAARYRAWRGYGMKYAFRNLS
jgi:hypothetical protein